MDDGTFTQKPSVTTTAQHESQCLVCDEDILDGDPIVLLPFEQEWIHEDCGVGCE